ncbi:MAG: hypothetical protein HXX14_12905 [Bacteroidetes bacterium]|nr:hypothetical protein [Bacteroidota bacterium]
MIPNLKQQLTRNLLNIPGWKTTRKIVVIESDDWGSIRMPSTDVYEVFLKKGYDVNKSDYNKLDSLESNDDLIHLYETLNKHRDANHKTPVITANIIVANPNFEKIKSSGFMEYHYEHFSQTLDRYPTHDKVMQLYKEGNTERLFHPQFHGREHLNVNRWMKALQNGRDDIRFTFDHETTFSGQEDYNFMEALDWDKPEEIHDHNKLLEDGLKIFQKTFGYCSKSFIASCYTWSPEVEKILFKNGIHYLQGSIFQNLPQGKFNKYKRKYHYLGEKNKHGQRYLVRNCFFEPSLTYRTNWPEYMLWAVETAFRWHKPAIISTHRINFIGFLNEQNRIKNLNLLDDVLRSIINKWPDVEFMTSDELGDLIVGE